MAIGTESFYRCHSRHHKIALSTRKYWQLDTSLFNDELHKVNMALAIIEIIGERYPEQIQDATGRK